MGGPVASLPSVQLRCPPKWITSASSWANRSDQQSHHAAVGASASGSDHDCRPAACMALRRVGHYSVSLGLQPDHRGQAGGQGGREGAAPVGRESAAPRTDRAALLGRTSRQVNHCDRAPILAIKIQAWRRAALQSRSDSGLPALLARPPLEPPQHSSRPGCLDPAVQPEPQMPW
jgi:hypothetical protein